MQAQSRNNRHSDQYAGEAVSPKRAVSGGVPLLAGHQYWLIISSEKAARKMLRTMTATTEFSA